MALSLAKTMVVHSRDLHDPGLEEDGHGDAAAPGLVAGGVGGLAAVGPPVVRPVEHQHQLRLGVLAVRRLRGRFASCLAMGRLWMARSVVLDCVSDGFQLPSICVSADLQGDLSEW